MTANMVMAGLLAILGCLSIKSIPSCDSYQSATMLLVTGLVFLSAGFLMAFLPA